MTPLDVTVSIDSTTWGALALALTVLGLAWTVVAFRRHGAANGLRALAWTLVPVAAWLTGTLKLAAEVLGDVLTWATRLVFSPTVWAGLAVAAVAVVLWFVSGLMLGRRGRVHRRARRQEKAARADDDVARSAIPRRSLGSNDEPDDDMSGIDAILKKHGI